MSSRNVPTGEWISLSAREINLRGRKSFSPAKKKRKTNRKSSLRRFSREIPFDDSRPHKFLPPAIKHHRRQLIKRFCRLTDCRSEKRKLFGICSSCHVLAVRTSRCAEIAAPVTPFLAKETFFSREKYQKVLLTGAMPSAREKHWRLTEKRILKIIFLFRRLLKKSFLCSPRRREK